MSGDIKVLTAEIIAIGTELLLGDVINTNGAFLAKELSYLGIDVHNQTIVGDNEQRIVKALEIAKQRADIIITSGGLGPTFDDRTKEIVAKFLNLEMIFDEKAYDNMKKIFAGRYMAKNNKKQAYVPKGATVLYNANGTAPGISVEKDGLLIIILPGPPYELQPMFKNLVVPILEKKADHILHYHTLHLFGIGESNLEQVLGEIMTKSNNPSVAPYASMGEVMLRVTVSAKTKEEAEKLIKPTINEIYSLVGQYIYSIDVGSLEQAVVELYNKKNITLAIAESCTGGIIASRITNISGSSSMFGFGGVTYANEAKMKILGVKKETLKNFGAVSREVALEMAKGVRKILGSDVGLSTTGIAGPTGATEKKPVGFVYVGVSSKNHEEVIELNLNRSYENPRNYIRFVSSSHALSLALKIGDLI